MARRPKAQPLTVAMNGRRVGELIRAPSGAVSFVYARTWLEWENAFAISLSLPLDGQVYEGEPVIAVFDNLLPDEQTVRTRLAERLGAGGADVYNLLAAAGRDCVGALQFLPEGEEPAPPGAVEGTPLTAAEIAAILNNLAVVPLGVDAEEEFRISLAGAQEKTALLREHGGWRRPLGTTPTTHILKPQIGVVRGVDLTRSVENEYLCLKLTEALGARTAQVEIGDFDGVRALVVERFDRQWARDRRLLRAPQEDLCQALGVPSARKYERDGGPSPLQILQLLGRSDDPFADRLAFLRALVIFWLLGATDGHAKNFSLRLRPGGGFSLAPLYDIVSLQPAVDAGQLQFREFKLSMAMGASRRYGINAVRPRHFVQTGAAGGVRDRFVIGLLTELAETGEAAIEAALGALPNGYPEDLVASITGGARRRLQLIQDHLAGHEPADT